jgi:hypothetical protein
VTDAVVDTNVALVANGMCEGVTLLCRIAAIDFLEALIHKGRIAVDLEGEIEAEYRRRLSVGTPGVGSRFLQKFFSEAAHRIERVSAPIDRQGNAKTFKFDGSLKRFDMSDRKFVAVSVQSKFPVYNATDSDWLEHREELTKRGVKIEFLCGDVQRNWFERKT